LCPNREREKKGGGGGTLRKPLPTQEVQGGRNREMENGIQEKQNHKQAQADIRVMQ